jgi:S1-C subfamily serine protease
MLHASSPVETGGSSVKKIQLEQYAQKKAAMQYDVENNKEFFSAVEDALLFIKTDSGAGTGFLISPEGCAITCNHVIEGATSIDARLRIKGRKGGSDTWHVCNVIRAFPAIDIALIQLEGSDFPYMKLALENREITRGEKFALLGYPFGRSLSNDYTSFLGNIASIDQRDHYGSVIFLINSEAKSGNSGSPVISQRDGTVIGILQGSHTEKNEKLTEEINYMRPIKSFWESIST